MSIDFLNPLDYIDCGNPSQLDNVFDGGATCCAWINLNSFGVLNVGRVADKNAWLLRVNGALSTLVFEHKFSTTTGVWRLPENLLDGEFGNWHHIAWAYDSSSTSNTPLGYFNGEDQIVTVDTLPVGTPTVDSSNALTLGNDILTLFGFGGCIEDFRIYNRILDVEQLQTIAVAQGADGIIDSLAVRYQLSEGEEGVSIPGSVSVVDSGPHSLDATTQGSLSWGGISTQRRRFFN